MTEYVTLRFRGLMLERLMQRALDDGVTFFKVRRLGTHEARLTTNAPGADKLTALAERFALDVQVLSRRGPGARLKKMRARWTLPVAFLAAGLICCSFLSRLWIVDVKLLDGSDPRALEAALTDLGVSPGMPMRMFDPQTLALALNAAAPELAYVGARRQGVRLLVEAAYALPAPDLYDQTAARDLVAAQDALLLSLDVNAGTAAAQPGYVVRKGQVLIRGEERDGRESLRGVCALGAAVGRVWLIGEAEAHLTQQVVIDTGRTETSSRLTFGDWSLPLSHADGFTPERTELERLPIVGLLIPLNIERTRHIEQASRVISHELEALKTEIAEIALDRALSQAPQGISPVDKWVDYSMIEGDIIRARAVVEIRVNIAVSRNALTDINQEIGGA